MGNRQRQPQIVEAAEGSEYEKYIYKCLAPMPAKRYSPREEYLNEAIHRGFHKKLLIFKREVVGQIEYAPAEVSGYLCGCPEWPKQNLRLGIKENSSGVSISALHTHCTAQRPGKVLCLNEVKKAL